MEIEGFDPIKNEKVKTVRRIMMTDEYLPDGEVYREAIRKLINDARTGR